MVASHAFNSNREAAAGVCVGGESLSSRPPLVYSVSSRIARAKQRSPVSKNKTRKRYFDFHSILESTKCGKPVYILGGFVLTTDFTGGFSLLKKGIVLILASDSLSELNVVSLMSFAIQTR